MNQVVSFLVAETVSGRGNKKTIVVQGNVIAAKCYKKSFNSKDIRRLILDEEMKKKTSRKKDFSKQVIFELGMEI